MVSTLGRSDTREVDRQVADRCIEGMASRPTVIVRPRLVRMPLANP
jgi:hypothetical protein